MWRLCCAGEISHDDQEALKYGSNSQTHGTDGGNSIADGVTRVSCRKRNDSESSCELNNSGQNTECDPIISSNPNLEPTKNPSVTVNPPQDNLVPKSPAKEMPVKNNNKNDDSVSLSSRLTASPNTKIRLLDLAEGRFTDNSDASDNDNYVQNKFDKKSASREEDDNLDDLASYRPARKKGPLSKLSDSRESILSIYSDAGEINYGQIPVTGEVLFGVDYDDETGVLQINVQECKDLAPVDTKTNRSDPYIKTYLLPDKTRGGKKKTKIKKHTLNPVFEEILKYNISQSEIKTRSLWLTVWNNDTFGRNDFLGEILLPLGEYDFSNKSSEWYCLQERLLEESQNDEGEIPDKGDLVLSMIYITPEQLETNKKSKKKQDTNKGELHVMIKEAHNITALHSNGTSNPFCKGYLLPDKHKTGKQKTTVVKKNCSPVWNQVFIFNSVCLDDLPDRSLELTIWDHDTLSSNDFLGGIRFNIGIGTHEGQVVDWMDGMGEEIVTWQNIIDNPNTWIDAKIPLRASMGTNKIKK